MKPEALKQFRQTFLPVLEVEVDNMPAQEASNTTLEEMAQHLGATADDLRAAYTRLGHPPVIEAGREMCPRWIPCPPELVAEMRAAYEAFEATLLGLTESARQGFITPDVARRAALEEHQKYRAEMAMFFRRQLGLEREKL